MFMCMYVDNMINRNAKFMKNVATKSLNLA